MKYKIDELDIESVCWLNCPLGRTVKEFRKGDIFVNTIVDGEYCKIMDIKDNRALLSWLTLEKSPNQYTDFSGGKVYRRIGFCYDENGYATIEHLNIKPLDELSLLRTRNTFTGHQQPLLKKCNCPTYQLMLKGCTCGGQ